MRIVLATFLCLFIATAARAADLQQCRAEESLHNQLVSLRAAGKTGDEAGSILAKRLMAQNPPAIGLGMYLEPLTIEVYLLGDRPSQIVADCYRDATDLHDSQQNRTSDLTAAQRGAIGDHVRECWTRDTSHPDFARMQVTLKVTTDAAGVARAAEVAGDDQARMADPAYRTFAERARRSVLGPQCANLPVPTSMMGKVNVVTFRFSP